MTHFFFLPLALNNEYNLYVNLYTTSFIKVQYKLIYVFNFNDRLSKLRGRFTKT